MQTSNIRKGWTAEDTHRVQRIQENVAQWIKNEGAEKVVEDVLNLQHEDILQTYYPHTINNTSPKNPRHEIAAVCWYLLKTLKKDHPRELGRLCGQIQTLQQKLPTMAAGIAELLISQQQAWANQDWFMNLPMHVRTEIIRVGFQQEFEQGRRARQISLKQQFERTEWLFEEITRHQPELLQELTDRVQKRISIWNSELTTVETGQITQLNETITAFEHLHNSQLKKHGIQCTGALQAYLI